MSSTYPNRTDQELLHCLQQGDSAALAELMERYKGLLFTVARHIVPVEAEAEELVADFFIGLWEREEALVLHGTFKLYATISVKNAALNVLKKRRLPTAPFTAEDTEIRHLEAHDLADDALRMRELKEEIDTFMGTLPRQRKLIFDLSRFQGMRHEEIATLLHLHPKTVANQVALAVQELAKHFQLKG
ncbi:ECF subfamily RNA polymerase sigma-24 subunit [Nitritalea halalkaliphila LW7]|uniref:ECF subfamily RNA polymerase sigma-24 subunit n=1 Tax=Nitritalea halalkaliphila LW7 TaxID=1189621 RepID=I5BVN3_9BACT|nr:sigma-70 family RNA polymerase sigma factor [Nitritalea halalkaliphila]EIM73635.1 ECF subfamily RNA polymerase sigma-24 subunit [Nitritalea halalkaliphila LW7]